MLRVDTGLQLSPPAIAPFGPGNLKSPWSRGQEFGVRGDWGADRSPRALQFPPRPFRAPACPHPLTPGTKAGLQLGKVPVTHDPLSLCSWHLALLGGLQLGLGQVLGLSQPDLGMTQGHERLAPTVTNIPGSQLFLFPETQPGATWRSQLHQALEEGTRVSLCPERPQGVSQGKLPLLQVFCN